MCAVAPSGKMRLRERCIFLSRANQLYNEMVCECDLQNSGEMMLRLRDLTSMLQQGLMVLSVYMLEME